MQHKKKQGRIGQQKPFPVVILRFRPVGDASPGTCGMQGCESAALFGEPQRAAFVVQPTLDQQDISDLQSSLFTHQEQGELTWEKAYREQRAGREPSSLAYPICVQCVAGILARFLGTQGEEKASAALVASVTSGQDIILFDRNISRTRTDPSVALGTFATVAEFRAKYWQEVRR